MSPGSAYGLELGLLPLLRAGSAQGPVGKPVDPIQALIVPNGCSTGAPTSSELMRCGRSSGVPIACWTVW